MLRLDLQAPLIEKRIRIRKALQIPYRISPSIEDVPFDIHPKSNKKIDDHWRTHGDKRNINKILSDNRSRYAQTLPYCSANTKNMPFNKGPYRFHLANLQDNNDLLYI
jgi:hypothetical protein